MGISKFVSNVFMLMTLGLFVTGLTGYLVADSPTFLSLIIGESGFTIMGWVILLSPLLIVLIISTMLHKISGDVGFLLFILLSILEGISLSVIFLAYTTSSILLTFSVTALTFFVMAIIGYTTKRDLTQLGSILMMSLIGILIAMFINWFVGSETMDYIISAVCVIIFTGLIAYDTQKLKQYQPTDSESMKKMVVIGAISLYLDFINLFLHLLTFLGDRKN